MKSPARGAAAVDSGGLSASRQVRLAVDSFAGRVAVGWRATGVGVLALALAWFLPASLVQAYSHYPDRIPNGRDAPFNGCGNCHESPSGGGPRTPFGDAFRAAGYAWSPALAALDSDGDGYSNGTELRDPAGTWTVGGSVPSTYVSNPGWPDDMNECAIGLDDCDLNATCTNALGDFPSFSCACDPGWMGSGNSCTDIDECAVSPGPCGVGTCSNTPPGSYTCACPSGFEFRDGTCVAQGVCSGSVCGVGTCLQDTATTYSCECPPGFRDEGGTCAYYGCIDGPCGANGTCSESGGSFTCACDDGYEFRDFTCADLDECADLSIEWCAFGSCTNTVGSFDCECSGSYILAPGILPGTYECQYYDGCVGYGEFECWPGDCYSLGFDFECDCSFATDHVESPDRMRCLYVGDCDSGAETCCGSGSVWDAVNDVCVDLDECTPDPCGVGTCSNELGGYTCACPAGYEDSGGTCADVDECLTGPCDPGGCSNAVGTYSCTCPAGYAASAGACVDVDECASAPGCVGLAFCVNGPGTFACQCPSGYIEDGSFGCMDVDECVDGSANCPGGRECQNRVGDFACVCPTGTSDVGGTCTNDDECTLGTHDCVAPLVCADLDPGFECACPSGFRSDGGGGCADIEECAESADDCGVDETCANTIGGFECCGAGYGAGPAGCVDVDECDDGSASCGVNRVCRNRVGTYACDCAVGYAEDGAGGCEDIDECVLGLDRCTSEQTCANTEGAFTCTCNAGWEASGTGCRDVDECAAGTDDCAAPAECSNTAGGFRCLCPDGFRADGTGACTDLDECTLGTHDCLAGLACTNTPGAFTCACPDGYEAEGAGCADVDECARGTDDCEDEVCTNTDGGFTCGCRVGYAANGAACEPVCGDGLVVGAEECDDGADNADGRPGACRTDCTRAEPSDASGPADGGSTAGELDAGVAPDGGASEMEGGCACRAGQGGEPGFGLWIVLALALLVRRRFRWS